VAAHTSPRAQSEASWHRLGDNAQAEGHSRSLASQAGRPYWPLTQVCPAGVRGVDLELNYNGVDVGGGTLSWRFIGSRLSENSILTPGSARDERVGDVGIAGLPETKVTTSLRYAHGPWSIFLQERYIGGGLNDRRLVESNTRIPGRTTIDDNTVDSVLYTDLTVSFSGGGDSAMPWETFFWVNNLTNEAPPDMYGVVGRAGVPGPNTFLYDTIGRRFVAGVRLNF
jgi:hypothetical protein